MSEPAASPTTTVFDEAGVRVGRFRCHPSHPRFHDSGPAGGHLLVFPRTAVRITHEGKAPVVADPTCVMLYNAGQVYRRAAIAAPGDRCEFFALPAAAVADAIRRFDPAVDDRPERPFAQVSAPSDGATYLLQRLVFERVSARRADALLVEEAALSVLGRVVEGAYACRASPAREGAHREAAASAREILGRRFAEALSLRELAGLVGLSPFHLARVFRRETGRTLHAHRGQLRLRASLERVAAGGDLTTLGLDLGYSSHSHFTLAFRRAFGVTPSRFRAAASARAVLAASKIVTA